MNTIVENKSYNVRLATLIVGIVTILIIFLIVILGSIIKQNQSLRKRLIIKDSIIKSKVNIIESKDKMIIEEKNVYHFKEDCETDCEALLRKHMEIYIKRRYTKTPTIIAKEISKNILFFSKKYKISPELILGIIEIESMFNPLLESSKGAKGLMQVMPEWAPKLNLDKVNDLHEIDTGIESGIKVFLIHLNEAKGSISGGLYRYVNKDHSYVERVYSVVGRFVTYRTTLETPDVIAKEEKDDSTDRRANLDNKSDNKPSKKQPIS